jgi:ABC-type spermidine/putrescine transport system permease subunit II
LGAKTKKGKKMQTAILVISIMNMIIPPLAIGFFIIPSYSNHNMVKGDGSRIDFLTMIVTCIVLMMASVVGGINAYIAYHDREYLNTSHGVVEIQYDEIEAYHYAE